MATVKNKSNNEAKNEDRLEADLFGITQICTYAEKEAATLFIWKRNYGFPIWKDEKKAIWLSSKKLIKGFFAERGLNPKTTNESALQSYREKQLREAGHKFFNRKLISLSEISDFCNVSDVTALDWLNFDSCPIEKLSNGNYTVDCDELYFWTKEINSKLNFNFNYKTSDTKD